MRGQCFVCGVVRELDAYYICDECHPVSCINCHVSDVQYDTPTDASSRTYKCSHGCQFTVRDYLERRLQTILYNGSWRDRLATAGRRVEYIIPNPEVITVHETVPNETPSDTILGTHFTSEPDALIADGVDPEELDEKTGRFSGTLRDGAAYAWPYKPSFAEAALHWTNSPVIFEVPESEVVVSSYEFLNHCSDDLEYGVPTEKYESQLTFTPEQLRVVCETRGQPAEPETLLISNN